MIDEGYKFKKPENVANETEARNKESDLENEDASPEQFNVLEYLDEETRMVVEGRIVARKQMIDKLVSDCNLDANKAFQKIFGVPSTHMEMIVKPFGLYFMGDEDVFAAACPSFKPFLHHGLMASHADDISMQMEEFMGMVGFGDVDALRHELGHMFNSMLPMHAIFLEYKKIKTDLGRGKDKETIREIKKKQYGLWADSLLKNEILARIDDGKILEAEEQKPQDVYSSGAKIFTTYEPDSLYEFISPYESDVKEFGIDPVSFEESDKFWSMYSDVVDPIRNKWLDEYNQNIRTIKKAISCGIEKAKIKAIVIKNPFAKVAIELGKEPQMQLEKSINQAELDAVVENFLQESSKFDVDCLDLKNDIKNIVIAWFDEYKDELVENFKDLRPQTFPPKQELLERLRPALPLDRIHIEEGVGLEFRRTKIVDNWVSEIYQGLLKVTFSPK